MSSRKFLLAVVLATLVAAPVAYFVTREQVGTARGFSDAPEGSTDGLSAAELKELGWSESKIDLVMSWREERAEMQRLEKEDARSLNVIPEPMPASTVEWCEEQTAADAQRQDVQGSDASNLRFQCEVIELAAEGRLAGGTYTDDELIAAKQQAESAE